MNINACVLQFTREANFHKVIAKARRMLEKAHDPDFILLGGEFSLRESVNIDPYESIQDLAKDFNSNIIAPINANRRRFPNLKRGEKGYSSTQIFDRKGEIRAIQDKQHFYWKEKGWFTRGKDITVFKIEGVKIGLMRGLDLLYPSFSQKLKDAELISVSTMAVDDMMLDLAKVRAIENQSYLMMSSFIGEYVGMQFIGNAAIIKPCVQIQKGMKAINQVVILNHISNEGLIESELDLDYIRLIKKEYPIDDL